MYPSLLEYLVCPRCEGQLKIEGETRQGDRIYAGWLICAGCEQTYQIKKFIPRFVDADQYADSFSRQRVYVRRHFEHYRRDRSGDRLFTPSTGIDLREVNRGLNLEVGCGYGRFLDVVSRHGGEIIGIDLSTHSVELAQDFVGSRAKVHVVQCDLFNLPFRTSQFDRIFSIGVLHHTPDTHGAFDALVPYLADDGRISIWVYPPAQKVSSDRWRTLTTRLPRSALYAWCIANQALFSWIRALPGGWHFSKVIPGAQPTRDNSFWLRVLSDFDNLSPQYAATHAPQEVREWFEGAGLTAVETLPRATAVTGRKP